MVDFLTSESAEVCSSSGDCGGLGLDRSELVGLFSRCPRVLLASVEDLRPRVAYLRGLGLSAAEVGARCRRAVECTLLAAAVGA